MDKNIAYQFPNQDHPYHLRKHGTSPSSASLCLQEHTSVDYVKDNKKQKTLEVSWKLKT
jgi:hypothetical protein